MILTWSDAYFLLPCQFLKIDGEKIQRAHEVKYLGVTADENLTWNGQYKKLKGKLKSGLSSSRNTRQNTLLHSKLDHVYRALFESHLVINYGEVCPIQSWNISSVFKSKAQALLTNAKIRDGWNCNWLSLSNLIKYDRAIMTRPQNDKWPLP